MLLNFNILVFVQTDRAHLHSLSLVRSCIQKAVGLLRDTNSMKSRSMRRINILLTLLGTGQGHTGGKRSHLRNILDKFAPHGLLIDINHSFYKL